MTKSLELLKELLNEDKIEIKEVLEALGYEVLNSKEDDVYGKGMISGEQALIGFDEFIFIKKEHR